MSYDIQLTDPLTRETLLSDVPHDIRGGTYATGGTRELWLNITYNYSPHFYRVIPGGRGIRGIYSMTGADSISVLEAAIAQLGDDADEDYWKATEGNAKRALLQLLAMAKIRPDGVWAGD